MHRLISAATIDFFIQIVGFLLAYRLQTEKFYDLTGSLTFILLAQISFQWNTRHSTRQYLVTCLVSLWAVRLGLFLFYRVLQSGGDRRFNKAKTSPITFLIFWLLQGVWIYITLFPTLLLNNKKQANTSSLSYQDYIGIALWLTGFMMEALADYQKMVFKSNPQNADNFINTGLWSISRHPNYFGEILLWFGIFFIASTEFKGFELLSFISPVFVYFLLCYVSGIPLLEKHGLKKFGSLPAYKHYIENTPILVPFVGSTS